MFDIGHSSFYTEKDPFGNLFPGLSFSSLTYTQVSAGFNFTCGLKSNGSVDCWGLNDEGQTDLPIQSSLFGAPSYIQVSAGKNHTCGLLSNDRIVCWGLGNITTPNFAFHQVSTGNNHACGVLKNSLAPYGPIFCWGSNSFGETTVPDGLYTQVSAGGDHTCGLKEDGSLLCWGNNWFGRTEVPEPPVFDADTVHPVVSSILRSDTNPTTETTVNYSVLFSEFVVGVDITDFSLTTTGEVTGAEITGFVGSGSNYTVTVDTGIGTSTIRLDVLEDDSIRDAVNLPLDAEYTTGETYTLSLAGPGIYDDRYTGINYSDDWYQAGYNNAYAGTLTYTTIPGSAGSFTFEGERITLLFTAYVPCGTMYIFIDGRLVDTINQFSSRLMWQQGWSSGLLGEGTHTITFKHVEGNVVTIDALVVTVSRFHLEQLIPRHP